MKSVTKFAILLLSTAAAMPAWAQDSAAPAAEEDVEAIVVTGMRQSMTTSVARKKNTMEIVESITADDIGKLPDPNVAETLTRVPGVQAYRFGGEAASPVGNGSGLTIRGLTGQTGSRVDGRSYFTAGSREFNVESASPGMVAGLDVYKNPSAEHIEGAIGGLVNIRTRRPFDFAGTAVTASVGGRYNDLGKKVTPEIFGLASTRWNVGDGEMGLMVAGSYSKSFNRGDNNAANGGSNIRRAIRADSAEYAANTALDRSLVGRSDVTYLADVSDPFALTAAERQNLISAVAQTAAVNQEDYMRTRKGLNAAFQWKPTSNFEFYVDGTYNYYLYHQNYRFLGTVDSRYVQNLGTAPFSLTETLANRNSNGGADEILSGQRVLGDTFLNSSLTSTGGDEHRRYKTFVIGSGFKWEPVDRLHINFDFSYVKADQYQDNRAVRMDPAAGLSWNITRDLSTSPQTIGFTGPDLSSPNTWVFNSYSNGSNQVWDDSGIAAALDLRYDFDNSFLKDIKIGGRYAEQKDSYRNYSYSGKNLTTNGLALAADRSNAISASQFGDQLETSPSNWFAGEAGYPGGFLVFSPDALLGDNVRSVFPAAGIPAGDAIPEILLNRRYFNEKTYAGYAVADFAFLDDRIRGNVGVRLVQTDTFVRAMIDSTPAGATRTIVPNERTSSYTDLLPSFNLTGYITPDTLVRLGYGKGITRPDLGALNPTIVVNTVGGTGSVGNPDLRPQKADSYDLSIEHYFSPVNYVSAGIFYKKIDGFFSGIEECLTVSGVPAYAGTQPNGCATGQYRITRTINAAKGTAKGVELAAQTFFDYDFLPQFLHNFGVQGAFTYVKTKNPLTLNGQRVITPQPLTSKYSWSATGFYEDDFMSARVVYTWRSDSVLFGVANNPIDGRYIGSFGLLDASLNFKLPYNLSLSLNASNLTNAAPHRYVGEPGLTTGIERQHFMNGRNFGISLRYSFGS